MKILVLGGTGAIGAHLVNLLALAGMNVAVTSRTEKASKKGVRYIVGDAQSDAFLRQILCEKWDAIIDFMAYSTEHFKNRLDLFLNATSQYVFLSSARVYAHSSEPLTEDSPRLLDITQDQEFLSTDEYALSKARQENLLLSSGRRNWTIIRPYITYSEARLQLGVLEKEQWLYRALHGRAIVFSEDVNAKATTLTYGLDVAKGISAIIGNVGALGEAFHITAKESILWKDVLEKYIAVFKTRFEYEPQIVMQDLNGFLKWYPGKYQVIYDRLYDRKFNNAKINQYVDINEFTSPMDGLKKSLEVFLDRPYFHSINWRVEALKDKLTNERASPTEMDGIKQKSKYFVFRYAPSLIRNRH